MKIAVLSDIHDNIWNLEKVLARVEKEKAKAIIFCGDYCSRASFKRLVESNLPVLAVFGNVDGDQYGIMRLILENDYPNITQEEEILEKTFNNIKIAAVHRPEHGEGLAATQKYDVVFHGHTHKPSQRRIRNTLLANPGQVAGINGKCTFGIYDTKTNEFKKIEIK